MFVFWLMKQVGKLIRFFTRRFVMLVLLLLLQFGLLVYVLVYLNQYAFYYQLVLQLVSLFTIIIVYNREGSPSVKALFIGLIALLPFVGLPFYMIYEDHRIHRRYKASLSKAQARTRSLQIQKREVWEQLKEIDARRCHESDYIYDCSYLPVGKDTSVKYYPSAESAYEDFMKYLKEAKHFIFLEFFIIHPGRLWDSVLEVLKQKAKEGVEVRLMYDDVGCTGHLPIHYPRLLAKEGIKCLRFNPMGPQLSLNYNYRDHRKICVIDGYIGMTGGFNLADEYVNYTHPYGYWKDAAVIMEGRSVWNLTISFLENWDFTGRTESEPAYYTPFVYHPEPFEQNDSFVHPFVDSPLDDDPVGMYTYCNILNDAVDYVWISTPYLVIDREFQMALELAVKRGVDVRIITPGIPDNKKITYQATRSAYLHLIKNGVKIYEYKPGFVHAKNVISDDEVMVCGTINCDFRSFIHHFENSVWVYRSPAVMDMKKDFLAMLEVSEEITLDWLKKQPRWARIVQYLIRPIAPIL